MERIEIAVWLIFGLLLVSNLVSYYRFKKSRSGKTGSDADWNKIVERYYEKGDYEEALQTLSTYELLLPRSASVKFWQGRCYFQLEAWEKAAKKFEECCCCEPFYRKSIRDYMAFMIGAWRRGLRQATVT